MKNGIPCNHEGLPLWTEDCDELVDLLGPAAAFALIEHWAGRLIYIPRVMADDHRLVAVLGIGPARSLAASRGGETIKVPLAKSWRILAYRARGDSYSDIAGRLLCTTSTVGSTLRRAGVTQPSKKMGHA